MTIKRYTLLVAATIGRTRYAAGASVPLDDRQSTWLAQQNVIYKPGITAAPAQAVAGKGMPKARRSGCGCGR